MVGLFCLATRRGPGGAEKGESMTTICVDVMGADKEPEVLLKGVTCALEKDPDLCVLLAGSAGVVEPYCASHERARALVTTEVIGMAEHPASAVRQKKDASIVRAAAAVRAGEADVILFKGSRGMKMERVLQMFLDDHEA